LRDFSGALVMVSHDRELLDRLCTEVVGLDGRGEAALYGSVSQWLTAYERSVAAIAEAAKPVATATPRPTTAPKARKLSYREQQEWEQMESAILAAEATVVERQAAVEKNANSGHVALAEACRVLEEAQQNVERLYARWQELDAKRRP
jgi:ATP-binding cassette subfamily F protein uup